MTLPIPLDALEGHAAIIGTTGSGKSTLVRAAMAELARAGRWVGSIDKMGNQWGLTLSADGTGPGVDFIIFGGRRGHVPMAFTDGERIAGLFVDQRFAAIFDVSQWKPAEQERWVADFADAIFRRNQSSLHLVIDEAQSWIPQSGSGGVARESVLRLATQGRGNGIHLLMACQRVSTIDKTALSMAPLLVVMASLGKIDIRRAADEAESRVRKLPAQFADELPSLAKGQGWIVQAGETAPQLVQFPLPDTFDSSRTPKHGDAAFTSAGDIVGTGGGAESGAGAGVRRQADNSRQRRDSAGALASIDAMQHREAEIANLQAENARLIETNIELHSTFVGYLDREARAAALIEQAAAILRETPRKEENERERLGGTTAPLHRADRSAGGREEGDQRRNQGRVHGGEGRRVRHENHEGDRAAAPDGGKRPPARRNHARHLQDGAGPGGLASPDAGEREIAAILRGLGPDGASWADLAILAGRAAHGGSWNGIVKRLRARGWVTESDGEIFASPELLEIDDIGFGISTDPADVRDRWKAKLGTVAATIIEVLASTTDASATAEQIGAYTGRATHGGSWNGAIKKLKTAGIVGREGNSFVLHALLNSGYSA